MDITVTAGYLGLAAGVLALLFAAYLFNRVRSYDAGTKEMQDIAEAIQEGAMAFLNREYRSLSIFVLLMAVIIYFAGAATKDPGSMQPLTAVAFLLGAITSAIAGFIGMRAATAANVRTANAARTGGMENALGVAFSGGAIMGMAVVGLGLAGLSIVVLLFANTQDINTFNIVNGFALGASSIALFARVGGGIYTKAADVGADLVGKVEAGIPEDDPRNPAVIADNVGDNVGDCAGMGADLFETYAVTAIGAVFLGYLLPAVSQVSVLVTYPLVLGAIAILASIAGTRFVKLGEDQNIMKALYRGVFASAGISVVGFAIATFIMFAGFDFAEVLPSAGSAVGLFLSAIIGIVVTILIMFVTEYYTGTAYPPVRRIAKASETGSATNIISGLAVGMNSTLVPTIILAFAIFAAFMLSGLYGIAVAAVAMLSITGMIVAMDTYGPITDNAGGIAEMSDLPPEVRANTDALDAVGNTTKAVTKGYAIGSAALAALVLFADYAERVPGLEFRLNDPIVLVGLIIGAMLPFLFSSYLMESVGKAAGSVIEEVRRQFREIPGIMERTAKPDYGKAVDIVTKAALREMALPGLLSVAAPLIVGFLWGPLALGGLLIGVIASGLMLALSMSNGGGAWDNAKKYIEDGNHGGKGSEAHAAAVVGDTVGDPYKDTAGPSINPLIKVINTVALIFAGIIASVGGILM